VSSNQHTVINLTEDYQNSSRCWNADIQLIIAKNKTSLMKAQPTVIYNFHGANARVNNNSSDSSTNVVTLSESQLFSDVKKALTEITDVEARTFLTKEVDALQQISDKPSRMDAYLKFIEHAANHMTILTPFLAAIAQWAGQ